jgi:hypothetical protein
MNCLNITQENEFRTLRKNIIFNNTNASILTIFKITGSVIIKLYVICKEGLIDSDLGNIRLGIIGNDTAFINDTIIQNIDTNELWFSDTGNGYFALSSEAIQNYLIGGDDDIILTFNSQIISGSLDFMIEWKKISQDGNVEV